MDSDTSADGPQCIHSLGNFADRSAPYATLKAIPAIAPPSVICSVVVVFREVD